MCPLARHRTEVSARVIAAGRWVVALGDGLELPVPAAAAVAGDVALAYTLYARTGAAPREPVVITGTTPVTRFLSRSLLAKGLAPVVVADPAHDAWIGWLLGKAITVVRATGEDEARPRLVEAFAAQGLGARPWRVVATSTDSAPLAAALAGPRATLTVLAPVATLPGDARRARGAVIGVAGAHPDLVVEVAAMCAKGEIDLAGGTTTTRGDPLRSFVELRRAGGGAQRTPM